MTRSILIAVFPFFVGIPDLIAEQNIALADRYGGDAVPFDVAKRLVCKECGVSSACACMCLAWRGSEGVCRRTPSPSASPI